MRLFFFGDGPWATNSLSRLIAENHSVLGVVIRAQPTGNDLITLAKERGLQIFQPPKANDPEFVTKVEGMRAQLHLSVSYDQILQGPIIKSAPLGFVNFHAGKLPHYRGRNVINWAIINGEIEIGLTAHYVNDGIDTGDIILQRTLPISWDDTCGTVVANVVDAFPELVADTVRLIHQGQVKAQPQAHLPGTYFPARGEGDEWLDWSGSSRNLYNKIRAITRPGPGSQTLLGDRVVKIWRAYYDPAWPAYLATPGQVVGRHGGKGVWVKTGDSTLLVQEVQVEGGDAGVPSWSIGTRLGINIPTQIRNLQGHLRMIEEAINKLGQSL